MKILWDDQGWLKANVLWISQNYKKHDAVAIEKKVYWEQQNCTSASECKWKLHAFVYKQHLHCTKNKVFH